MNWLNLDSNLLGAVATLFIDFLLCLIFISRIKGAESIEYWTGILFIFTALPLIYLLLTASGKPGIYFVQIGLMLTFILAELLLDYIFRIEFRDTRWMVIIYVTLFFAAIGGMIGVASHAGRSWMYAAVAGFFITTALALVMHSATGK